MAKCLENCPFIRQEDILIRHCTGVIRLPGFVCARTGGGVSTAPGNDCPLPEKVILIPLREENGGDTRISRRGVVLPFPDMKNQVVGRGVRPEVQPSVVAPKIVKKSVVPEPTKVVTLPKKDLPKIKEERDRYLLAEGDRELVNGSVTALFQQGQSCHLRPEPVEILRKFLPESLAGVLINFLSGGRKGVAEVSGVIDIESKRLTLRNDRRAGPESPKVEINFVRVDKNCSPVTGEVEEGGYFFPRVEISGGRSDAREEVGSLGINFAVKLIGFVKKWAGRDSEEAKGWRALNIK